MNITGRLCGTPGAGNQAYPWGFGNNSFGAFIPAKDAGTYNSYGGAYSCYYSTYVDFDAKQTWTGETSYTGSSQAVSLLSPYLSVYMWKRIA